MGQVQESYTSTSAAFLFIGQPLLLFEFLKIRHMLFYLQILENYLEETISKGEMACLLQKGDSTVTGKLV